jgi:bifunctional N-acetylglucosamine-1-phosphate-uridyltransferase/glucosamine-1-phosphate-acetyltransferase GlmU-like protein
MIHHVVGLFPGETKFTFICNQAHLDTTPMRDILLQCAPNAAIVAIAPHKLGPVHAVLQIKDRIDPDEEVIVNYCDFSKIWDYPAFLEEMRSHHADGGISAYRGFHPHMLGSTNYAFMRDDDRWMLEIKEKSPFTDNRMAEYASDGTYYFRRGDYVVRFFEELIASGTATNGEFYVSMVYNLLVTAGLTVRISEISHMWQWGTPEDLAVYQRWSDYFRLPPAPPLRLPSPSVTVIPAAGRGARFATEGHTLPKPLIPIDGLPMIIRVLETLPQTDQIHIGVQATQRDQFDIPGAIIHPIHGITEGQACTVNQLITTISDDSMLMIAPCDNAVVINPTSFQHWIDRPDIDAIILTYRGYPVVAQTPTMYGWVRVNPEGLATDISVKVPISDDPIHDHVISGAFWFRRASDYRHALTELIANNQRVNGEFYIDSMMQTLLEQGKKVAVCELPHSICWGTPLELKMYKYFKSAAA